MTPAELRSRGRNEGSASASAAAALAEGTATTTAAAEPPAGARAGPGERLEAHCDSCGRFVGPYTRCPYCGARLSSRLALRTVKLAAVLLSTIGLALLWVLARGTDIPTVAISDVTGMMNLAYVQVSGRVVRGLTYDPESDYLGFWLLDETGEMHVNVYRDVTRELLNDGKVPAIGDEVTVAGTVRLREDFVSLTVDVPDHLEIQRPAATPRQARGLTPLDEGRRVRLAGTVKRITSPYEGLTLITLSDDSGDIVIAVEEATATLSGIPQGTAPLTHIAPGQALVVEGTVTLYRGTPQVVPARISDIVLAGPTLTPEQPADEPADGLVAASPSEPAPRPSHAAPTSTPTHPAPTPSPSPSPTSQPLALSRLSAELEGETVRVAGKIVLLEGLRGGVKATLDDGTAQVVLLLWDNVHSALPAPASLDVGAEVAVTGTIQLYEGVLEIIPSQADDVHVLAPAPPPPWVAVNALTPNDAGRVVRIRGVLGELEGFSAGVKAPLNDGAGEITVLFWSNLYETFDPRPQAGQQVEITGLLSVFQQRLELIPRSPYDWRVKPPDGEAGNN